MAFQRGQRRGGGGGGGQRGGRAPLEYILTGTTYREVNKEKVEDAQEEWQLAITIPTEVKTKNGMRFPLQEMIEKLQEILDTNGDLGARLVMYCSPRENQRTGEEFSATNVLVQPKMEQKPQGGRSGGGFRGRSNQSQGRRSYPPSRQEEPEEQEEEQLDDAPEDMPETRSKSVPKTGAASNSGGRTAPKSASPSKPAKKQAPPVEDDGPPEPDFSEDEVPI